MTTRTELSPLVDIRSKKDKRALWEEVDGWDEDEAVFKGRDLWIRAVKSWCVGGEVWHDDRTIVGGGSGLTSAGEY